MTYKSCVVPKCTSTSIKTPNKLFLSVPTNPTRRKKWLELSRRDPNGILSHSNVFMCEDHFNIETDIINYMKYKLGFAKRLLIAEDVVPTKFACQESKGKKAKDRGKKIMLENSLGVSHIQNGGENITEEQQNIELPKPQEEGRVDFVLQDKQQSSSSWSMEHVVTIKEEVEDEPMSNEEVEDESVSNEEVEDESVSNEELSAILEAYPPGSDVVTLVTKLKNEINAAQEKISELEKRNKMLEDSNKNLEMELSKERTENMQKLMRQKTYIRTIKKSKNKEQSIKVGNVKIKLKFTDTPDSTTSSSQNMLNYTIVPILPIDHQNNKNIQAKEFLATNSTEIIEHRHPNNTKPQTNEVLASNSREINEHVQHEPFFKVIEEDAYEICNIREDI